MQNRMLAQGPLHRTDGILSEAGYALAPIKDYDRGRVKAPRRRIKEWDYYLVTSPAAPWPSPFPTMAIWAWTA